jgi:AcrR family transcriptional regulator
MSQATADARTAPATEMDDNAEAILATAAQLFSELGYKGCSMERVAASLGATKPFVYYRYKDKAELLAAICERSLSLTEAALEAALAGSGSATDRLADYVRRFAAVVIDQGPYVKVYQYEAAHLREADVVRLAEYRAQLDKRLRALIKEGTAAGEFQLEDPAIAASSVNGLVVFITFWYKRPTPESRAHAIETLEEYALRLVGARRI